MLFKMKMEGCMETYTLLYLKEVASGNLLYDLGSSDQCPGGVGWGERWRWGSRVRGHIYTYGCFMLMYGRNQHNIVKQLSFS